MCKLTIPGFMLVNAPLSLSHSISVSSLCLSSHRYMVDAADHEKIEASKNELHSLLDKPQLAAIPVS